MEKLIDHINSKKPVTIDFKNNYGIYKTKTRSFNNYNHYTNFINLWENNGWKEIGTNIKKKEDEK